MTLNTKKLERFDNELCIIMTQHRINNKEVFYTSARLAVEFIKIHFNELYIAAYNNLRKSYTDVGVRELQDIVIESSPESMFPHLYKIIFDEDYFEHKMISRNEFIDYIITNRDMIPFWLL